MSSNKVDKRINLLLEKCVRAHHRSMYFILGKKAHFQVVVLHDLLVKLQKAVKPSVLWCFKRLGFSTHKMKLLRHIKKKLKVEKTLHTEEDLFQQFLTAANVQFCHYNDTEAVLGQTFGMAVIQDFEFVTPNILARIIETVQGGGIIIFLLPNLTRLKEIATLQMNVHTNYLTEAQPVVIPRFNRRFYLSLSTCEHCFVLNDKLEIMKMKNKLEPSETALSNGPSSSEVTELLKEKEMSSKTEYLNDVIGICQTADQAKALKNFHDCLLEQKVYNIVVLTSARGRGKSSALGLSVALSLALNYSNIYITCPHPQNVQTLFTFLINGLNTLGFKNSTDYSIGYSSEEQNQKYVASVEMFKSHQFVRYIAPNGVSKCGNADLVIIDEAAAIPSHLVKSWIGPYKVFMASTINGYEGTGRSLSLKLITVLRSKSVHPSNKKAKIQNTYVPFEDHHLCELTLTESIRYKNFDPIELWLNSLLCLDVAIPSHLPGEIPKPKTCNLYYIDRDVLFSYHKAAEEFLQNAVSLFVSSHYKNSPNDLIMMADVPAHHLFCLLPPVALTSNASPDILCVIQVALEGGIDSKNVKKSYYGKGASGDLIPWLISQQFLEDGFLDLHGARVVRIATHPQYQRMGYGLHAIQLICEYYKGKYSSENLQALDQAVPLLIDLNERKPEKLNYIGVSYGLTIELLRFWKKADFVPLYVRQTQNDVTGEHSCVMIKPLRKKKTLIKQWLPVFWMDFSERYIALLSSAFKDMPAVLAFNMLSNDIEKLCNLKKYTTQEIELFISQRNRKCLEMYTKHLVDFHLILDLVPTISRLFFLHRLKNVTLPYIQAALLLCLGLQNKSLERTASELSLQISEVMGHLAQIVKRFLRSLP